jgi:hypothetical protein
VPQQAVVGQAQPARVVPGVDGEDPRRPGHHVAEVAGGAAHAKVVADAPPGPHQRLQQPGDVAFGVGGAPPRLSLGAGAEPQPPPGRRRHRDGGQQGGGRRQARHARYQQPAKPGQHGGRNAQRPGARPGRVLGLAAALVLGLG